MMWKTAVFSTAALLLLAAGPGSQTVGVAQAACDAGVKIDGTTADMAKKKMEGAGFLKVRDLKKGCDNFWHGIAVKDGSESGVLVTPDGRVMREAG
jgi:hypothetical protein